MSTFTEKMALGWKKSVTVCQRVAKKIYILFIAHPKAINETYGEHFRFAGLRGLKLVFGGLACIIHSIFPFFFVDTASRIIHGIHSEMTARKNKDSEG
jgi:hypothetical protein